MLLLLLQVEEHHLLRHIVGIIHQIGQLVVLLVDHELKQEQQNVEIQLELQLQIVIVLE
jgi:hypothetical protein